MSHIRISMPLPELLWFAFWIAVIVLAGYLIAVALVRRS